MPSPSRALAWQFAQQHRWGLCAVAAYMLAVTAAWLMGLDWALPIDVGVARFVGTVAIPLSAAGFYLVAVFSYGTAGDLAAQQSTYPARMFTLPVTTASLVMWPMVFGTLAIALLLQTGRLAPWPEGVEPPFWVVILGAVVLAWTQVLSWTSYPIRGLRIVAAVAWLVVMDVIAVVGVELKARESLMMAILIPQLPVAYLAAYAAVTRARRGEIPDWRHLLVPLAGFARVLPQPTAFASPLGAQTWCEWRQHGWSLPVQVALVLPFALGLLFLDRTAPAFLVIALAVAALTPPIMASFAASTVRRASPRRGDDHGLTPFLATRPLTSAALVAAKLRVTLWSTLLAWLLVLIAVPLALTLSDTWPLAAERARQVRDAIGLPRAVGLAVLVVLALMAMTWKRLVTSLYVGLSGRSWMVRTHIGITLVALVLAIPLVHWILTNRSLAVRVIDGVPAAAALLVTVKMATAAWIATRLDRSRLIDGRVLVTSAAVWLAAVLVLYAVLAWMADTPHIPRYVLMLLAILAIPLTRLSAAPLALALNRHR
jgi:hypothetical protein